MYISVYIYMYIYIYIYNAWYQRVTVGHMIVHTISIALRCCHIKMALLSAPSRNVVMAAGAKRYPTSPTGTNRFGIYNRIVFSKYIHKQRIHK